MCVVAISTTVAAPIRAPDTVTCGWPSWERRYVRVVGSHVHSMRTPSIGTVKVVSATVVTPFGGVHHGSLVHSGRAGPAVTARRCGAGRVEQQVVRAGPLGRADVARRVLGAEVDEHSGGLGRVDPLGHTRVGAGESEHRTVHRREQVEVAGTSRPHRADRARQVGVEQGDEAGDPLDVLLDHGVGLFEPPLRPGRPVVVDLDRHDRAPGDRRVGRQARQAPPPRRAPGAARTVATPARHRPGSDRALPMTCRFACRCGGWGTS